MPRSPARSRRRCQSHSRALPPHPSGQCRRWAANACRPPTKATECRRNTGRERMSQSPLAIYQAHLDKGELAYQWSPEAGRAVFYPAPSVPLFRQHCARMAGRLGARHGLCDDRHLSAPGRRLQYRADRLRRRLPADGPGRGHRSDGGQDRHAGEVPRASGRAATSRPIRSSCRSRVRRERAG